MNELIIPKRIDTFLKHIYGVFPILKKHPDYTFYYLYSEEPNYEYLICVITDYLLDTKFNVELNEFLNEYSETFQLTNATIMSHTEYIRLEKDVDETRNKLRKTENRFFFFEVW